MIRVANKAVSKFERNERSFRSKIKVFLLPLQGEYFYTKTRGDIRYAHFASG